MEKRFYEYQKFENEFSIIIPKENGTTDEKLTVEYYGANLLVLISTEIESFDKFLSKQDAKLQINELSESEFKALVKTTPQMLMNKTIARTNIRSKKDLEDDLTDQKLLTKTLILFCTKLYNDVLTQEQRDLVCQDVNINEVFETIYPKAIIDLDISNINSGKIDKIINDEINFNDIVNEQYKSKIN